MSLALELTIFNKLFAAVAEEMGIVLRKSAFSPNIKERRDYSCAVCTAGGELLAQAAHIPVHLGAVPRTMGRILPDFPLAAGDVLILNNPYWGGTHLPDLTLIAPVYIDDRLAFFLLNRAHHADVGGRTPGSMPLASDLREEGVIISPTYLYRGGQLDEAVLKELLGRMRVPAERRGDLAAQLAALHRGQERLPILASRYGLEKLLSMSQALLEYSRRAMEDLVGAIPDGVYNFVDYLDDDGYGHEDLAIALTLTILGQRAVLDFRQTCDQVTGGVNRRDIRCSGSVRSDAWSTGGPGPARRPWPGSPAIHSGDPGLYPSMYARTFPNRMGAYPPTLRVGKVGGCRRGPQGGILRS
ncbi:MAG: hydantoinase B/oxoprolinase family protein [Gammaproteobacteria bacterium]